MNFIIINNHLRKKVSKDVGLILHVWLYSRFEILLYKASFVAHRPLVSSKNFFLISPIKWNFIVVILMSTGEKVGSLVEQLEGDFEKYHTCASFKKQTLAGN